MTKEELGNLIIASTDSLYRISKSILRNEIDCEDAVSEAIVKSFDKIDTLQHASYAKTWLVRILINSCYSKPDYQVTDDKGTNYGNDQIHINQIQSTSEDIDPVLVIKNDDGSADCISKIFISDVPEDAKQLTLQLKHNGQVINEISVEISLE